MKAIKKETAPKERGRSVYTRGVQLIALLCSAVTVVACHDFITEPRPLTVAAPRRDLSCDPNCGATSSSTAGGYDGIIDTIYGGAPEKATPTGVFPHPTFVSVRVVGVVTQIARALAVPDSSAIKRQPTSNPSDPGMWGVMGFRSGGAMWWASDTVTVARVVNDIYAMRNDAGGQPLGDATHCGKGGYQLCWSWTGQAHLEFTRIHVGLTISRTPDTTAMVNSTVAFSAGMTQEFFPGNPNPVDMSELTWRWIPDAFASTDTVTCSSASGRACSRELIGAGTMHVGAYVNGEWQEQTLHVDVRDPCHTGLDYIDNTVMDTAFKSLWRDSHYSPTTPQSQRQEVGGWIIRNGDGSFSFQRFNAPSMPCGINVNEYPPPSVVAFVHTHPWEHFEIQTTCGPAKFKNKYLYHSDGTPIYPPYQNMPSEDDREIPLLFGLSGFVLDNEYLTKFSSDPQFDQPLARCGY